MNPEMAVAIFNGLCIAGGALISFGSIVILEISKRNKYEKSLGGQTPFVDIKEVPTGRRQQRGANERKIK